MARAIWEPWMLREYGITPAMVRDFTRTELSRIARDLRDREAEGL